MALVSKGLTWSEQRCGWEEKPRFESCCVASLSQDLTQVLWQLWLWFLKIMLKEIKKPHGLVASQTAPVTGSLTLLPDYPCTRQLSSLWGF